MKSLSFVIRDEIGLHARPAGLLVKEAAKFSSSVTVATNNKKVDAKKIFGIMSLGAKCGDELAIEVSGDDEDAAVEALEKFLNDNL